MNSRIIATPIGALRLVASGSHLVKIEFGAGGEPASACVHDNVLLLAAVQLQEYFAGRRNRFELPLAPAGTAFQRSVWAALADIPWGEVRSYGDIAMAIGNPTAARAVGAANSRNPLPIVIPCHRVIGSNGSLTGFAGGLGIKRQLLELEGYAGERQAGMDFPYPVDG